MSKTMKLRWGLVCVGILATAVGCSKEVPPAIPSAGTTEEEPAALPPTEAPDTNAADPSATPLPPPDGTTNGAPAADGAAAPATGDQSEAEMIKASFASLSAEDREAATKQKICPVGGVLGTMGTPIKVNVAGQEVFICCEHCEEPLKADPAKHLAKLGLQPIQAGTEQ